MSKMLSNHSSIIALIAIAFVGCGESVTFQSTQALSPVKSASQDATGQGQIIPGTADDNPGRNTTDGVLTGQDGDESRDQIDETRDQVKVSASFAAYEEKLTEQTIAVEQGIVSTSLVMQDRIVNKTAEAAQIERRLVINEFTQGNAAEYTTDTRTGLQKGVLDLLVVIDTSGSMGNEQNQIKTRLPDLLSEIADAEWRIAVVTTDPGKGNPIGTRSIGGPSTTAGCLRQIINKDDADKVEKFNAAIDAGLDGTGTEQGIRQSLEGLTCLPDNQNSWLRANSTVAVLIVSDEDNCSTGSCGGKDWSGASNAVWPDSELGLGSSLSTYLHSIRPLDKSAVYAIHWSPDVPRTGCASGYNLGTTYKRVVQATGGTEGLICAPSGEQPNFAAVLRQISKDVQKTLQSDFLLSTAPTDPTKVVVKIGTDPANMIESPSTDFSVVGTTLTFVNNPPKNGDTILITYESRASEMQSKYFLSEPPADGTLKVTVAGDAADYTLGQDDEKYFVLFKEMPPAAKKLKFEFREKVVLPSSFIVDSQIVELEASIKKPTDDDYEKVEPTDYTLENGSVIFASAPTDGSEIKFAYKKNLGVILSYPITVVGETPHDFAAFEADTGDALEISYSSGIVTFAAESAVHGKKVKISYANEDEHKMMVKLAGMPVKDSITINSELPCALGNEAILDGQELSLNCDFGDQPEFQVSYKTLAPKSVFTLAGVKDPEAGTWQVKVGDKLTTDFVRQGPHINLAAAPAKMDAKVTVTYTGPN